MRIHFLNVKDGSCSIIEHDSGRVTMIDVCNGNAVKDIVNEELKPYVYEQTGDGVKPKGDYGQDAYPVAPISYYQKYIRKNLFRFILTHPDMDHMDGFQAVFQKLRPANFWDMLHKVKKTEFGKYRKDDWDEYLLYHNASKGDEYFEKRHNFYAGSINKFYNEGPSYEGDISENRGDRITILSPTRITVSDANSEESVNDLSYVLLVETAGGQKIVFAGDAEKLAWDAIVKNWSERKLGEIDILIAPHHGRRSGGNDSYLDVLRPKVTFFGNAPGKYLNYDDWNNRGLLFFTNNEIGSAVVDEDTEGLGVYFTNEKFTRDWLKGDKASWNQSFEAWKALTIKKSGVCYR